MTTDARLATPAAETPAVERVERPLLGGRVGVHVAPSEDGTAAREESRRAAASVLDRVEAWAARLTRFDDRSDLCRLNASTQGSVAVHPTLAAVLDWGRAAETITDGLVNVTMLDARLAAEGAAGGGATLVSGCPARQAAAANDWSVSRGSRTTIVHRPPGLRFDLDGVAKGWLADRALELLSGHVRVIDADGDIAIRLDQGWSVSIGIDDPGAVGSDLAVLRLPAGDLADHDEAGGRDRSTQFGVATSGITRHAWSRDGARTHHLIDPRTLRPADTDVVQATVVARTARVAEAIAKAAVIVGSGDAIQFLDRPAVLAAVLLTADRRLLLTPAATRYLA